jgi:hypothetical protein
MLECKGSVNALGHNEHVMRAGRFAHDIFELRQCHEELALPVGHAVDPSRLAEVRLPSDLVRVVDAAPAAFARRLELE